MFLQPSTVAEDKNDDVCMEITRLLARDLSMDTLIGGQERRANASREESEVISLFRDSVSDGNNTWNYICMRALEKPYPLRRNALRITSTNVAIHEAKDFWNCWDDIMFRRKDSDHDKRNDDDICA